MADVRERLARLNPSTVRFDVGRGGTGGGLSSIDVAGALGMVPAGLGREVLEAAWWPDGASLRRERLRDAVIALVQPEIRRQAEERIAAGLDLQLAVAALEWSAVPSKRHRQEREQARTRYEAVAAACWPRSTLESLPALADAVLLEIRTGFMSDRARAAAIGRDEAGYRRNWRPVYLWLLDRMREAEEQAARQLARALRRGNPAT